MVHVAVIDALPAESRRVASSTADITESLAARLVKTVLGCYLVVTMIVTGIQLVVDYSEIETRLQRDLTAIRETFSPGIADAVWRFNNDVLRGILSGMKEMPFVIGVKVVDEHGNLVQSVGTIEDNDGEPQKSYAQYNNPQNTLINRYFNFIIKKEFPIEHLDLPNRSKIIGNWTVYSNKKCILREVFADFCDVLLNSLIRSLILCIIIAGVIKKTIGRPLQQLSSFIEDVDIDNLGLKPFVLSDPGRHELHRLTDTLNVMTVKIRRSVEDNKRLMHDLRELNANLHSKVEERTRELETLATTDLLTGLFNRRKLDKIFIDEVEHAKRQGRSLSMIIGDIDDFKSVNDQHGHQVGDDTLAAFACILKNSVRSTDAVGRWGGEEFLIICSDTNLVAAAALADDVRKNVAANEFRSVGQKTCSFGVAALLPGDSVKDMIARADAALYKAKVSGRNRVHVSAPTTAMPKRNIASLNTNCNLR